MRLLYTKPKLKDMSQGSRIAFARQFRLMTQDNVSDKLGLTGECKRRTMTRYEKGNRNPKEDRAREIANILDVNYNAIKKYDFPIYGYVTCNPYYSEDMETALKKINEDKYLGVKLYQSKNNYPYDGKLYEQLLNNVQQSGKFFLLHGTPEEAESVLKKYPNLLILLAHATQNYLFMDKVLGLQSKYSNLYIDICNRYMTYRALEYLVANGDSTRIIFGSDSNLLSQAAHVGWLAYSNISYDDKKNIFSNNIKKLVKKGKCNI